MTNPSVLRTTLCLFFTLAAMWAFAVPVRDSHGALSLFQPDEPNHIAVIAYIAAHGQLPPYAMAYYESAHPPLYHLGAALIFHFAQPLLGTDASVRLLRLVGVGLGTALVWLVWQTALPMTGKSGALLCAVIAGGVPMFVSLSASVTNETLAALAGAGALAGLTAGVRHRQFSTRTLLTVALWTAVGVGTKITCLGLLPVSLAVIGAVGYKNGAGGRHVAAQMGAVLLLTGIFSGWWYVRNTTIYGDPLRQAQASALWERRIPGYAALSEQHKTTPPRYLARVTFWGWASFWGVFDAFRRPLPASIYVCLAAFQGAALYGLARSMRGLKIGSRAAWSLSPLAVAAIPFAAAVAMVYYRYTWEHFTPQGRFFFPLLLPFAVFTGAGWLALRKQSPQKKAPVFFILFPIAALALLNGFVLLQTLMTTAAGSGGS